jgi:hypothetical protein
MLRTGVLYTPRLLPGTVRSSETSVSYRDTLKDAVTHLEADLPRLVVLDSVEHIVGVLAGICNTEQKTR